jgi:hypothetical protein
MPPELQVFPSPGTGRKMDSMVGNGRSKLTAAVDCLTLDSGHYEPCPKRGLSSRPTPLGASPGDLKHLKH